MFPTVAVGEDEAVGFNGLDDGKSRSSLSVKVTGVTLGANVTGRCCGFVGRQCLH